MKTSAALLTVLALLVAPALAQTPDTVFLEELTWPELRALVAAGKTTIILPIGGTEQNGPHMALGKHNVRVRALSERIARKLGNALVGPVIAYVPEGSLNPPTGHMRFPGTITVPDHVFRRSLESAARSVRLAGFRNVVFLGDHGSTQAGAKSVAAKLNKEWTPTARAHAIEEYYQAATVGFRELLRARGYQIRRARRARRGARHVADARHRSPSWSERIRRPTRRCPAPARAWMATPDGPARSWASSASISSSRGPWPRSKPQPTDTDRHERGLMRLLIGKPQCGDGPGGDGAPGGRRAIGLLPGAGRPDGAGHAGRRRSVQPLQRDDGGQDEPGDRERADARLRAAT